MFSIYGTTGQVFSGPLESMNRVYSLARARNARGVAQEGDEIGVETTPTPLQQDAVRAYRRMLPKDLERGPLIHAAQIMTHPVTVLHQADHVSCHRDDAVLAQQADGFAVFAPGGVLADGVQGVFVVAFDTEQKAQHAGFFVERQDVSIAHDVAGTG